jgi:hypothetical protein
MKALAALFIAASLAGCTANPAPPGTVVAQGRLAQLVVPGQTTRADLLATFGKTTTVVFDSGYEAWRYQSPAGGGQFAEFVILLDPQGVVKKTRSRAPAPP